MIKELVKFAAGYRLRNLKPQVGREGYGWSASIYKDSKKIGTAFDDASGGPVHIDLPQHELDALIAVGKAIPDASSFEPAEYFLSLLSEYTQAVSRMVRANKKYPIVLKDDLLDESGIPTSYAQFKCANTPENLAAIRAKNRGVRLFDDEISLW